MQPPPMGGMPPPPPGMGGMQPPPMGGMPPPPPGMGGMPPMGGMQPPPFGGLAQPPPMGSLGPPPALAGAPPMPGFGGEPVPMAPPPGVSVSAPAGGRSAVFAVIGTLVLSAGGAAAYFLTQKKADDAWNKSSSDDSASPSPTAAKPADDQPAPEGPAGTAAADTPAAAATGPWDGKSTLTCQGNDEITMSNVVAHFDGEAIIATGNCELTCENCTIEATRAVSATGNAQLRFKGGRIVGTEMAITAMGAAVVTLDGTAVDGFRNGGGFAKINDLSEVDQPDAAAGPAMPPPDQPAAAEPAAVAAGDDHFAGTWTIAEARTLQGQAYQGTVTITRIGDTGAYQLEWKTSGGAYQGLGLQAGEDTLYAAWSTHDYGVAVYRVQDGKLSGRWMLSVAPGKTGSEDGSKPATKLAVRQKTTGTMPGGQPYKGEIALKDKGEVWDVSWYVDGKKTEGIAIPGNGREIEAEPFPVLGVGLGKGAGIVRYELHGEGELRGVWAVPGPRKLAVENLTR